ncbi:hypothetical protein LCGC14_2844380 [marine sediment metagenome]|uniref:Uncharacterized protein n=1 Tax=marine sediment metagenome TaxID=412755 RepID=A0A0F8YAD5_9ZZZZ
MKTVLLICWLTLIAFVCWSVYAIIWLPLKPGVVIFIGIFVLCIIWAGKGEIELRRYEKIDWYKRMGFCETACLLERDVK